MISSLLKPGRIFVADDFLLKRCYGPYLFRKLFSSDNRAPIKNGDEGDEKSPSASYRRVCSWRETSLVLGANGIMKPIYRHDYFQARSKPMTSGRSAHQIIARLRHSRFHRRLLRYHPHRWIASRTQLAGMLPPMAAWHASVK